MNPKESALSYNHEQRLPDFVRKILVLFFAIAASLTAVTHCAQICGISFSVYAIIGVCVTVLVAVLVLLTEFTKQVFLVFTSKPMIALALLTCCLLSALLCLVSHRPDTDDSAYVPNVIYSLEHSSEPMDFEIHYIDSGREDEPFLAYHGCSIPFEFSQGIVAYIAKTHMLNVYYFVGPALFGFMIPLVWFYLISRFSLPPRSAITGAFFICLSLLLMGEQHRSFGNFAFNRIFQGKTVMFTIGIPLFTALTMDFFRSPCLRTWIYLFATSVAMIGATSAAAMLIPLFAFVLAISCSFSFVSNTKDRFVRSFYYFCTLIYPALYAISILLLSMDRLGVDKAANRVWPTTFFGHARFVLNGRVVFMFLVAGTILAIILLRKCERRFLVIWILSVLMFYLNPIIAPLMVKYITSPNIYWRVFYLLPFPLVIGLSIAGVELRLGKKSQKLRYLVIGGLIIILLFAHLPKSSSSVFQHGSWVTKLGLPKYKVNPILLDRARKVLALSPPAGSMLAISSVSITLPMLTSIYPQISYRKDLLQISMEEHNRKAESLHRLRASDFLGGRMSKESLESLIFTIQHNPQIRSIVADRRVAEAGNKYLFGLLKKLGFDEYKLTSELVVFICSSLRERD